MSRRARLVTAWTLATFAAALLPGVAFGSTLQISTDTLFFDAAAGETNNVTISREPTVYRVRDPGSNITAGVGCAAVNANEVTCAAANVVDFDIRLGNLNDTDTIDPSVTDLGDPFERQVQIQGGDGDDTLNAAPNVSSSLFGQATFTNGPGADTLNGGPQDDLLSGSGGNDTLAAGAGFDTLIGGTENDVMAGGDGFDFFQGGGAPDGADVFSGGPSFDRIEFRNRVDGVVVTLDDVADDGAAGEGDNVMSDLEDVSGGQGPDTLVGTQAREGLFGDGGPDVIDGSGGRDTIGGDDGADSLTGGSGNDDLVGGDAADTLAGGDGDDVFESSAEADDPDVYSGGAGSDLLTYADANSGVAVTLDGVADDGVPGENDNAMADLEEITGSRFADTITGNASANQFGGGEGDDTLTGLAGSDGLTGGTGSDSLDGGGDRDLLVGGSEADRLRSRDSDPDEISCGAGVDALLADRDDDPGACEQKSTGVAFGKAKLAGAKAKIGLSCPRIEAVDCKGKLTLRKGKREIGDAKFSIAFGKSEKAKVKLNGIGDANKLKVDAETEMTDAAGAKAITEKRLVLKGRS